MKIVFWFLQVVVFFVRFLGNTSRSSSMEEITKGWNQMSLQGPEKDQFDLRSDMGSKDSILAAKFYTKRVINVEAVA